MCASAKGASLSRANCIASRLSCGSDPCAHTQEKKEKKAMRDRCHNQLAMPASRRKGVTSHCTDRKKHILLIQPQTFNRTTTYCQHFLTAETLAVSTKSLIQAHMARVDSLDLHIVGRERKHAAKKPPAVSHRVLLTRSRGSFTEPSNRYYLIPAKQIIFPRYPLPFCRPSKSRGNASGQAGTPTSCRPLPEPYVASQTTW